MDDRSYQFSLIAPGIKDTIDDITLSSSPLPQSASTVSRQPSTSSTGSLEKKNLSHVRKFEGLKDLLRPIKYNGNNSTVLDETNGLTHDEMKDRSSLGLIDLDSMRGLSMDLLEFEDSLRTNSLEDVVVHAGLQLEKERTFSEQGICGIGFDKNADQEINTDAAPPLEENEVEIVRKNVESDSKSTKSLQDLLDDFKKYKDRLSDDKSRFYESDVFTTSNEKNLSDALIMLQGFTPELSNSTEEKHSDKLAYEIQADCVDKDAGADAQISDEENLVFKDEDGDYVTNLAFRTDLQQASGDSERFDSNFEDFQGLESEDFVSAKEGLNMFAKDEEEFVKESKFKMNNNVVVALPAGDNQGDNSWAVTSTIQDITRPSWLSPPSAGKSYMRISIGQFWQAKTEALGSLGHDDHVERPNFGTEIFSPPQADKSECSEKFDGTSPVMAALNDEPVFHEVTSSTLDAETSRNKARETSVLPASNVSVINISAISKLLNDASINSDPKALADIIMKLSNPKANSGSNSASDDLDSKNGKDGGVEKMGQTTNDSVKNWLNAAGTVVNCPSIPISPVCLSSPDYATQVAGRHSPVGAEVQENVKMKKTAHDVSTRDRSAWKEPRLSSIYFRRDVPAFHHSSRETKLEELQLSDNDENRKWESASDGKKYADWNGDSPRGSRSPKVLEGIPANTSNCHQDSTSHENIGKQCDAKASCLSGSKQPLAVCIQTSQKLVFGEVLCVGISSTAHLPITNCTSDWLQCSFSIVRLSINGKNVDHRKALFVFDKQLCMAPFKQEKLKIVLVALEEGEYSACLKIVHSPMSWNKGGESAPVMVEVNATAESPKVKVILNKSDTLDFGTIPDGCSVPQTLSLMSLGKANVPLRLQIRNNSNAVQSFNFSESSKGRNIFQPISPTMLSGTLVGGCQQAVDVGVVCHAQFMQVDGAGDLTKLTSKLHLELDSPNQTPVDVVAPIDLSAVVGLVKLHIRCNNEPLLIEGLADEESKCDIHLKNSGQIPFHLKVCVRNEHAFSVVPSELALYPSQQGSVSLVMKPQDRALTIESMLLFMVQPNGHVYEVDVVGKVRQTKSTLVIRPDRSSIVSPQTKSRPSNLCFESNRSHVSWPGVPLGTSEKQRIALRNSSYDDFLEMKTFIKGSSEFKFVDGNEDDVDHQELVLAPRQEFIMYVLYTPKAIAAVNGKIVFQSQSKNSAMQNIKFTIKLAAYGGLSKLEVKGIKLTSIDGDYAYSMDVGKVTDDAAKVFPVTLFNSGDRSMFVKVIPCQDLQCRQVLPSNLYAVHPNEFILSANESKTVIVTIKPKDVAMKESRFHLGSLYIVTGDEIRRQKLRSALKIQSKKKIYKPQLDPNDPILAVDFNVSYNPETAYKKEIVGCHEDVPLFYSSLTKLAVALHAERSIPSPGMQESFSVLKADDTISSVYSQNFTFLPDNVSCPEHVYEARTGISPPVRDQDSFKIPGETAKNLWHVVPSDVILDKKSNGCQSQVDLVNDCDKILSFEVSWPGHLLVVHPASGRLYPKSSRKIRIRKSEGLDLSEEKSASVYISCNDDRKEVRVHLKAEGKLKPDDVCGKENYSNNAVIGSTFPLFVNQEFEFQDTVIGSCSDGDFEMFNASFHHVNWTLKASPLLVKEVESSKFFKLPVNFFEFSSLSGVLNPRQQSQVRVHFKPHFEGTFKQTWTLNVVTKTQDETSITIHVNGKAVLDKRSGEQSEASPSSFKTQTGSDVIPKMGGATNRIKRTQSGSRVLSELTSNQNRANSPTVSATVLKQMNSSRRIQSLSSVSKEFEGDKKMFEVTRHCPLSLSNDSVQFPTTAINSSSTMKVTVKNSSKQAYELKVSDPNAPFHINHHFLKVKPKCYVSLPVFFRPKSAGSFSKILTFKSSLYDLKVKLSANAI